MSRLRYDGVVGSLADELSTAETTITLEAPLTHSGGTAVPTISGGDYLPITVLSSNDIPVEIVYLTAYTAGATSGTISRGEEGTSDVTHAAGRIVVHAPTVLDFAASLPPAGTAGQVLTKDSGTDYDASWQDPDGGDVATDVIWNAKGDLAVGTGADTAVRLPVGADGYQLVADSGETEGVKWEAPVASAWNHYFSDDLSSLANWTNDSAGAWTISGGVAQSTGGEAHTTTKYTRVLVGMRCQVKINPGGGTIRGGFSYGRPTGTSSSSNIYFLETSNGGTNWSLKCDIGGTGNLFTIAATGSLTYTTNTWAELQIVAKGKEVDFYFNDVWVFTSFYQPNPAGDYLGLYAQGGTTQLRNMDLWTPNPPW